MTDLLTHASLLRKIRKSTEVAAHDAREHASQLGEITCKDGCSNCCRQKVLSTPGEGLAIYYLLRLQDRWTPELEERLLEEDAHATRTAHDEWFEERRPCAFLEGDRCGVYAVRPPGCWSTFSVGGDPELCAGVGEPGQGQLQVNALLIGSEAAEEVITMTFALEAQIPNSGFMTLPGAVLRAAWFARREPDRRLFMLPDNGPFEPGNLIKTFDEEGKKASRGQVTGDRKRRRT